MRKILAPLALSLMLAVSVISPRTAVAGNIEMPSINGNIEMPSAQPTPSDAPGGEGEDTGQSLMEWLAEILIGG